MSNSKEQVRLPAKWLDEMKRLWFEKEPDRIKALMANEFCYYEDPLTETPIRKIEDLVLVWQEIRFQTIEWINIDIIYQTDTVAVARWAFKQKGHPESVGCYFLEVDRFGKCVSFRQWWNTR